MKKPLFILTIILICLAAFYVSTCADPEKILDLLGYWPGVIISGSMSPSIETGDVIIVKATDPKNIKTGDIITYRVKGTIPNTHRVIDVLNKDGQLMFKTKGDANRAADKGFVLSDQIIGVLKLKIPQLGYIHQFLKNKTGFTMVLIIILLFLTAAFQVRSIILQVLKKKSNEQKGSIDLH